MHSAILVIKMGDGQMNWTDFTLAIATNVKDGENAQRLGENVWLLNFQKAPADLAWLIVYCERHGFEYGILRLADAPQWLPVGFDPKPS